MRIALLTEYSISGVVLGVSLVGSVGTMMGAYYTDPDNTVLKHTFWLVSSECYKSCDYSYKNLHPGV